MEAKICSHCKRGFPVAYYYRRANGYHIAECKECFNSRMKAYHKTPKGYEVKTEASRKYHRNVDNPRRREFSKTPEGKAYHRMRNQTTAHIEQQRRYKRSELGRKQSAINESRRRSRIRNAVGDFTLLEWEALQIEHNHTCAYCGRDDVGMTIDHVVPISRGGEHSIDNIVPACEVCNSSKNNRLIDEWAEHQNNITG